MRARWAGTAAAVLIAVVAGIVLFVSSNSDDPRPPAVLPSAESTTEPAELLEEPRPPAVVEREGPEPPPEAPPAADPEPPPVGSLRVFCRTQWGLALDGAVVNAQRQVSEHPIIFQDVTGRTDTAGVATFEDLVTGPWVVRGTADGYAPSAHEARIAEGEQATLEISLVPSGRIAGRVTSSDGSAIGNGLVLLHRGDPEGIPAGRASTGEDGGYAIDVPVEEAFDLVFRAPGHVPRRLRDVRLTAGPDVRHYDVRLEPACSITGRVTDAAGAGLERIAIHCRTGDETYSVASVEGGEFAFHGLPAGEYEVWAERGRRNASPRLRVRVQRTTTVELVLASEKPRTIRGRVLDSSGKPVGRVYVYFLFGGAVRTGKDGRFRKQVLAGETPALRVGVPLTGGEWIGGWPYPRVTPEEDDTGLTAWRGATLKVRLLGPDGKRSKLNPEVRIYPLDLPGGRKETLANRISVGSGGGFPKDDKGALILTPLPPGRFRVFLNAKTFVPVALPELELREGEVKDLGEFRLQAGGGIRTTLRTEKGGRIYALRAGTREFAPRRGRWGRTDAGEVATELCLEPGRYDLLITSEGCAPTLVRNVRVDSGKLSDVEVTMGQGARLTALVVDEAGRGRPGVEVRFRSIEPGRPWHRPPVWVDGYLGWFEWPRDEMAVTDDLGRARFTHLIPGQYDLAVAGSVARTVELRPGVRDHSAIVGGGE